MLEIYGKFLVLINTGFICLRDGLLLAVVL